MGESIRDMAPSKLGLGLGSGYWISDTISLVYYNAILNSAEQSIFYLRYACISDAG